MKDDQVYLRHILDAIEKIESYIQNDTHESFSKNDMMIDAVVRELEIIGEATNHISKELRREHRDIPWRDAIDMRNFLTQLSHPRVFWRKNVCRLGYL